MSQRVLAVFAHPDDEILACGATLFQHATTGDEVSILILSSGITSRLEHSQQQLTAIKEHAQAAGKLVGAKNIELADFPDNSFDTVAQLELAQRVELAIEQHKPHIVYTHYKHDLNRDHQLTHDAVLVAARPKPGSSIQKIYACEVNSSTEWNFSAKTFAPNTFITLSEQAIEAKIKAMLCYESELCEWPHPRSCKGIEVQAQYRGMQSGREYAEGFELVFGVF